MDVVKDPNYQASTRVKLPDGSSTPNIPVERGTIQGDIPLALSFFSLQPAAASEIATCGREGL